MKVLVTDDDPTNRSLMQALLRQAGAATEGAASAEEAIAALRSGGFDAVFSDVQLPGMNGFTLSREAERAAGRHVPFVAYSGKSWKWVEHDEVRAKLDAFVTLPTTAREVRAALEKAVASWH